VYELLCIQNLLQASDSDKILNALTKLNDTISDLKTVVLDLNTTVKALNTSLQTSMTNLSNSFAKALKDNNKVIAKELATELRTQFLLEVRLRLGISFVEILFSEVCSPSSTESSLLKSCYC
jgi:hypothetical protein